MISRLLLFVFSSNYLYALEANIHEPINNQVYSFDKFNQQSLPTIKVLSPYVDGKLLYITEGNNDLTNAEIEFSVENFELSDAFSNCLLCLTVVEDDDVKLTLTCIETKQRDSFTIQRLPIGNYLLKMFIKLSTDAATIPHYESIIHLQVTELNDKLLPKIESAILNNVHGEFAVPNDLGTADVSIDYRLVGWSPAINQLYVCIKLYKHSKILNSFQVILNETCAKPENNRFTFSKVTVGDFQAVLYLRQTQGSQTAYPTSEVSIPWTIHEMEEFIPSYEWQPLREWHTIPSGIETRLPLDGGTHHHQKEARIPDPWRLQLTLPAPCGKHLFFRMDVYKTTTIADIRESVGKLCGYPVDCVSIASETDQPLAINETVEGVNLFNIGRRLVVNEKSCGT